MTFELTNNPKTNSISVKAVILSMFTTMLIITTATVALAQSETEWLSDKDGKPEFHFRIHVENPDGSDAENCVVSARARDKNLKVAKNGDTFHVALCPANLEDFYNFRIIARSADGRLMAHLLVPDYQVRQVARDGVQLKLKPARSVEINVVHDNISVPDANVEVEGVQKNLVGKTDENGIARFVVPAGEPFFQIAAWTSNKLVGGIDSRLLRGLLAESNEFKVELDKCRDQRVIVKDPDGNPISNLVVSMRVSKPAPLYGSVPYGDLRKIKTNENGEAIFNWMPNWENYRLYANAESDDWQRDKSEETKEGFMVQFKPVVRKPRKRVIGRIELPPGEKGGFLLTAHSFQGEQERRSDGHRVYVDAKGNYELNILQGSTYSVHVNDARWGSNIWDGLIFEPKNEVISLPEIQFIKKVPVEIVATQGANKKPIRSLNISMANPHRYTWKENGREQGGNAERRWSARTDENGIARTLTSPGEVKSSVYLPDWRTEKSTITRPGETTRIELHRSTAGSQTIPGTVSFPEGKQGDLANSEIIAYAADGESSGKAETTTSDKGEFQINLPGTQIAYLVTSPDGKFAASGITTDLKRLQINLHPCVTYQGQLVNKTGQPFANSKFSIEANISFPRGNLGLASSFAAKTFQTLTDVNGNFEFVDCIPTNIKLKCRAETADGKTHHLESLFFEPDEVRERQLITIHDSVKPRITDYPLSRMFASKVNDARLINAHVLVVINQKGEQMEEFIESNCFDDGKNKDVLRYLTIQINESRTQTKVDAGFLSDHNWSVPDENEFIMLAIGANGNELGRRKINTLEDNATGKVTTFLADHVPDQKDARVEFEKALAEARRTDRKVWARICQTRCGPCFLLSRWIDKNREQLEKEFVLYKVDNVNEKNGIEILKKIMPEKGNHGVPFHAVFDSEGNKLIDSRSALGNIGYPGSSYEGSRHLKKMLSMDLRHLKLEEIQQLIHSLN